MKTKKYLSVLAFTAFVLVSGFRIAEDPLFLKNLKESLRQYNENFPEEKVYVHLDKPFYKPGEDMWFNVFVLNSNSHKATSVSDVVYVELIDPKGNVASKLDLVIREGTAHGDFSLQSSAPGGMYQVRAYTNWMKNFEKDNFFKKDIQVQRIITPRLLLKLDYAKESYGSNDQVAAKLMVRDLKDQKIPHASIEFSVSIDGKRKLSSTTESDSNGEANVVFNLPDSLSTTDGLLQVIVKARGIEESISRSIPIVLNDISIQFLPEGGNWVENVNSRVAFKAVNEFGKGADVTGSIVNESKQVVARFESFHMGMGAFRLKPTPGEKYFARIDNPSGKHSLIPLPEPSASGLVMNAEAANDTTVTWSIYSPVDAYVNLAGRSHGEMIFAEQLKLQRGNNSVPVSTKKFPAGIAEFTLFDYEGVEQCERLIFVNGDKGLKIQLTPGKKKYLPREQVRLEIRTVDGEGNPVPSKVSLSVVDDQLITYADDKQDNILSSMLLSSELKGEIQEPSFYFDPNEPKAREALDFLMMTQGWRRFIWKDVYENNRTITYSAEKNRNLYGSLQKSDGVGIDGEVVMLELGGRKRLVKVQTTQQGYFTFRNIDPTIPLMLLTRKPGTVVLKKETPFTIALNDREGTMLLPAAVGEMQPPVIAPEVSASTEVLAGNGLDVSLDADVTQLSEVVVTALGVEEQRAVTGSVVHVRNNSEGMFASTSIENILQGRVSGVTITPQSGNPASQANIRIRGTNTLGGGNSQPLYVIDGHPIGTSLNQNFSNGSMVGPEDIESISVINSPEASALYGCMASNGVILISTRSKIGNHYFPTKDKATRYSSLTVTPRKFSVTREFYVAPPTKAADTRKDFRNTIYWNHTIVTDKDGKAKVSFYNNDMVSAFRITAEGFSEDGLIGRNEEVYYTELPLSLDVKLPQYLGYEDELRLPVNVRNESSSELSAKVSLWLPPQLSVKETLTSNVEVPAGTTERIWYTISAKGIEGEFPLSIKLESANHSDEVKHIVKVKPVGFPMGLSFSAKELDKTVNFSIRDAERNSVRAEVVAFPDILSDLFTGAEAILREPHGCFEQVSSSTFPNILVLQYLKQSGLINPAVEKRALALIQDGYSRLTGYEVKGGGFDWFGRPPASQRLTAYGLVEFHEMKKVFPGVNERMIDRTREWLLSQRTGDGGFSKSTYGSNRPSAFTDVVADAYITYALSETGTKDILVEYDHAFDEAIRSKDMYRMALVANTAFNLGKTADYNELIKNFKNKVTSSGFNELKADHSVVWSYGNSLGTEVISLWTVALMKSSTTDFAFVEKCIKEILSRRTYGQFGSTQATTLALKALTEYAGIVRTTRDSGEIQVFADNSLVEKLAYEKDIRGKLILDDLTTSLKHDADQSLRINFAGTKEPLPYSVDIQWYTKTPQSNERCKVALITSLSSKSVALNESVRLTAVLSNKTNESLPMTLAVIGIPAGLSAQPWQLKELQEKEVFDFYEIMNGNLVIYYRTMDPDGERTINLDLKAEIPGSYVGGASSAYLYYTNEYKHWVAGNNVVIQ